MNHLTHLDAVRGPRGRSRLRNLLVTGLAGAGLALGAAGTAHAGTYKVHACHLPDGRAISTDGWTGGAGPNWAYATNDCANGGGLTVSLDQSMSHPYGTFAEWAFEAPADTKVVALELRRAARVGRGVDYGSPTYVLREDSRSLEDCVQRWLCQSRGSFSDLPNSALAAGGLSTSTLHFLVACYGGGSCPAEPLKAVATLHRAQLTLEDSVNPTVGSVTGQLAREGTHAGVETADYTATDRGSGIYRSLLEVDGQARVVQVADANNGRCADALPGGDPLEFLAPQPCKLAASDTVTFNTRELSEGAHSLRLRTEDAAGNRSTVWSGSITVDNVPPPKSTSAPVITGPAREGELLVTDAGAWSGEKLSYRYRWQRQNGTEWEDVPGAEATTYRLSAADTARRIRTRVTATNSEGSVEAFSAPTSPVAAAPKPQTSTTTPTTVAPSPSGGSSSTSSSSTATREANGTGASPTAALLARFTANQQRTVTAPYGRRVPITGTLTAPSGEPIGHAQVSVFTQTAMVGSPLVEQGKVVSDAAGRFTYTAPAGPSRRVRFGYRAYLGDTDFAQTADVDLQVVGKLDVRPSARRLRNGQTLGFRGKVHGVPAGSRKLVELQVRRGRGWMTFATTRSGRAGAFAYRYRFLRTTRATTYGFRARAVQEAGWPYRTAASPPFAVRVRP